MATVSSRSVPLTFAAAVLVSSCTSDEPSSGADAGVCGVAVAGAGGTAGSTTDGSAGVSGGGTTGDAGECQDQVKALLDFVHANKSCAVDADCEYALACANWPHEFCGGGFYVKVGYDRTAWTGLKDSLSTCSAGCFPGCGTVAPAPRCWRDQCWGSDYTTAEREQCLVQHGGEGACAECICGSCYANSCINDAGCAVIYTCAVAAGCLGKSECDVHSASWTCKDEVDATGGPGSLAAVQFSRLNTCVSEGGCPTVCSAANP